VLKLCQKTLYSGFILQLEMSFIFSIISKLLSYPRLEVPRPRLYRRDHFKNIKKLPDATQFIFFNVCRLPNNLKYPVPAQFTEVGSLI
jgi:hypothetical protein